MLVGYVVKLLAITVLYVYMYLANVKRDREQEVSGDGGEHLATDQDAKVRTEGIEGGMLDMTELDNKAFRYSCKSLARRGCGSGWLGACGEGLRPLGL